MSQLSMGSDDLIEHHDHSESPLSIQSANEGSEEKSAANIPKDEEYFMEGTFMVFQVERCLFRVPSYLFSKESDFFAGMFGLPQPQTGEHGGCSEGSSEANPIILPDEFTKNDFKCLLKALYPLSFTLSLSLSKEDWLSVLKLSTKWYFLSLRNTAISELGKQLLTSLELITYGRRFRISSWLISGLLDLVTREESINDDDALDIDSEFPTTAYRLFRAREQRIRGSIKGNAIKKRIEYVFKRELLNIRSDENAYGTVEAEIVGKAKESLEDDSGGWY